MEIYGNNSEKLKNSGNRISMCIFCGNLRQVQQIFAVEN